MSERPPQDPASRGKSRSSGDVQMTSRSPSRKGASTSRANAAETSQEYQLYSNSFENIPPSGPSGGNLKPFPQYSGKTNDASGKKAEMAASRGMSIPTELHAVCASPSSSLSKLNATLLALGSPAASKRDPEGRTPLHLLGRNELLVHLFLNQARYETTSIATGEGIVIGDGAEGTSNLLLGGSGSTKAPKTELEVFIMELVRAYPRAVICTDEAGRIPLTDAIIDWIEFSSRDVPLDDFDDTPASGRIAGRSGGGAALEGMSALMGDDDRDSNISAGGRRGTNSIRGQDDATTGARSYLTNLSLPSAFRSAYSASADVEGAQTRAAYRRDTSNISSTGNQSGRNQSFHNVWNAATPRTEGDRAAEPNDTRIGVMAGEGGSVVSASTAAGALSIDDCFPLNLSMPPVVEWCLRMLSMVLDSLESIDGEILEGNESLTNWRTQKQGSDQRPGAQENPIAATSGDASWIGNTLVSAVASIPSFMKTLLLLDDKDPVKERIFNLTIVKRSISSKYTIGNWLVYMLEAVDPTVAHRGVDYLEMLSEDEHGVLPSNKRIGFAGSPLTPKQRVSLYNKVSRLDYFIPAILALENTAEVDRASSTRLLRYILDKELRTRQTLTMAFFDLFFLAVLLVSFQMGTNYFLENAVYDRRYMTTFYLSLFGILYAILRKFGQMSSMVKISRLAFVENNFRWIDALDWAAIGLVTGGVIWIEVEVNSDEVNITDEMRSYLAAATGALWLKTLCWLNVINWEVANFTEVLHQVLHDIRSWLLFLVFAILAFSQMFFIMLSKEQPCENGGFCDAKDVYLQVYSVVLGEFDVDDFQTVFSIITFVTFTVVVSIILFYTLIAIVVDSYHKTVTLRSESAEYGNRSRLVYISELRAFRRLFDGEWTLMQYCAAILFISSACVVFLFSAVEIRDSLDEYYDNNILAGAITVLMLFLFVSISAFVSHMTYFNFSEPSTDSTFSRWCCQSSTILILARPIDMILRYIVDIDEELQLDGVHSVTKAKKISWLGGATHVRSDVKRMLVDAEAHSAAMLRNEMNALELRTKKSAERTRTDILTEIRASEERLERMVAELQSLVTENIKASKTLARVPSDPSATAPSETANLLESDDNTGSQQSEF